MAHLMRDTLCSSNGFKRVAPAWPIVHALHTPDCCRRMTATTSPLRRAIDAIAVPGHPGGSPAHRGRRRIGAAAGRNGCVCRKRAQGAARQRSRAHRCAKVAVAFRTTRRAPFRSRRQACRSGRMESSGRWRTMPKSPSRRWRRSVNSRVSGSISSRPSRSPRICWISSPRRRSARELQDDPCHGRLLFSVKEAIYKAVYPLDRTFLDHHDVEVSLSRRRHRCGPKWPDRQLPLLCCDAHCCAGIHSGAAVI